MKPNGGESMPRKRTEPPSQSVRIHQEVYDGLQVLAAVYKKSLPQFASEVLKPIVEAGLGAHGIEYPIAPKDQELAEITKQVAAKFKGPKK